MKYIKTFENSEYKKYILLDLKKSYEIIEIVDIRNNYVLYKLLFIYKPFKVSRATGKLGSLSKGEYTEPILIFKIELNSRNIYETDNLNELLDEDFLRSIKDINKYNL